MNQVGATVVSSAEVMPGVYLMWLESAEIVTLARPGQFVMVWCGEETVLRRPLSIHRVDGDRFALLFLVVGKGTQWLAERQPRETLDIIGPLGNGFAVSDNSRHLLLVAGGMGIAPLRFLADEAVGKGKTATLLYGTASRDRLLVPDAVTEAAATTEDGSYGIKGMITDLISQHAGWADQVFACGPPGMYRTMAAMPCLKGKPVQVSLEARMGCGRGICFACTVNTRNGLRQVCTDGPVFALDEIVWDEFRG